MYRPGTGDGGSIGEGVVGGGDDAPPSRIGEGELAVWREGGGEGGGIPKLPTETDVRTLKRIIGRKIPNQNTKYQTTAAKVAAKLNQHLNSLVSTTLHTHLEEPIRTAAETQCSAYSAWG